jgi:hypothetical protein
MRLRVPDAAQRERIQHRIRALSPRRIKGRNRPLSMNRLLTGS